MLDISVNEVRDFSVTSYSLGMIHVIGCNVGVLVAQETSEPGNAKPLIGVDFKVRKGPGSGELGEGCFFFQPTPNVRVVTHESPLSQKATTRCFFLLGHLNATK